MCISAGFCKSIADSSCMKDRKSTRLNSSHSQISYAVFCLKKKKELLTPNEAIAPSYRFMIYTRYRSVHKLAEEACRPIMAMDEVVVSLWRDGSDSAGIGSV